MKTLTVGFKNSGTENVSLYENEGTFSGKITLSQGRKAFEFFTIPTERSIMLVSHFPTGTTLYPNQEYEYKLKFPSDLVTLGTQKDPSKVLDLSKPFKISVSTRWPITHPIWATLMVPGALQRK